MKRSKHNICYSPKKVRTILERSIGVALDSLKCYCNDPVSNFTRCRKIPARTLIECIMSFSNYSSIGELSHFFEGHGKMPSASALSQKRKLLDPDIFKHINNLFVSTFDDHTTINGYHILVQDGSDLNIPFMDDKPKPKIMMQSLSASIMSMHYMTVLIMRSMTGVLMQQARKEKLTHLFLS